MRRLSRAGYGEQIDRRSLAERRAAALLVRGPGARSRAEPGAECSPWPGPAPSGQRAGGKGKAPEGRAGGADERRGRRRAGRRQPGSGSPRAGDCRD